jgi:threonine aldolase
MPETPIDLRSDGVTRPSPAMREAMAAAPVGDIQFGDDPTVNHLQERVAELLDKEAALWLPSGTMVNQIALKLCTRPGDDVIVSREAHAVWHEAGGSAANAGVHLSEIGAKGVFSAQQFREAIKPHRHPLFAPTTLVEIENTHNRAGGVIFPQAEAQRVCAAAKEQGIATFLDGARLWNVAVATGHTVKELAQPFDLVGVALSKGLGAPGGSLLVGQGEVLHRAVRYQRMFGGAMRQVGIFAAAGLYALEHNFHRLAQDHQNAQHMATLLTKSSALMLDRSSVQTNMVVFELAPGAPDAATLTAQAREQGVLIAAFGPRKIRLATHLDVNRAQCEHAAEVLRAIIEA